MVKDKDGKPQETSRLCTALYMWKCALLGGLLGVSRSVERECLSVVSYPRFLFEHVLAVTLLYFIGISLLCLS